MTDQTFDTVIIGSGPAGLTAAIYNVRANLKTIVINGDQPGGQLTITTVVENYPGFPKGIGGFKLMMDMQEQVRNLGVEIRQGIVNKVYKVDKVFKVELGGEGILETRAVIVATGAKARWLNLPNEKELIGKGVSACATCDGMFFKDKTVAVVGGGDVACEDAMFLSKFASKVYLIHRRDELRAQEYIKEKIKLDEKIEFVWNSEVVEIVGKSKVESLKVKNNKTGEEKVLPLDGLFVAVGHDPATGFVKELVKLKETGHIVTRVNERYPSMTTCEGVFAAGDCVDDVYRQAIIAAGNGAEAGMDGERWIGELK